MSLQPVWKNGISASALVALALVAAATAGAGEKNTGHPKKISWKAANMHSTLEEYVDRAVAKSISDGQMSGCVVLIGREQGIVLEKAYGNRCVEPQKEPMTTDTLFDMASLTKPLATATSVMILIERGQLRLVDKVAKFFPEFAAKGKQDVTIEELLVHSSGMLPDDPLVGLRGRLAISEGAKFAKRLCSASPGRDSSIPT